MAKKKDDDKEDSNDTKKDTINNDDNSADAAGNGLGGMSGRAAQDLMSYRKKQANRLSDIMAGKD